MLSTSKLDDQLNSSSTLSNPTDINIGLSTTASLLTATGLDDSLQVNNLIGRASALEPASAAVTASSTPLITTGGTSFNNATSLGSLSGTQTIQDYLGVSSTRPDSYYRFTLNTTTDLNLVLTGLTADADLRLLNSAGAVVATSLLYGYTQDETINLAALPAGEYYVRVNRYNGNTGFTLNLSTNPISNLLSTEVELGNVGGGIITQTGNINNANTSDTYHFSILSPSSNFTLSLNGLSADADVRVIRDANRNGIVDAGEVIARSIQWGAFPEAINLQGLGTGDYFIQVYQGSIDSATNYTLSVQGVPGIGSTTQPNGTINQAVDLGTLNGTRHFSGSVGYIFSTPIAGPFPLLDYSQDFYRFTLGATSNVSFALTGLNANADIQIIRDVNNNGVIDAGEVVATAASTGSSSEFLNLQGLGAGDYFVRVYWGQNGSGLTNYNLTLQAEPGLGLAPSPGYINYIGNLNGPRDFGGSLSDRRTSDFYEFTLETTSNVSLTLGGLTGNLNLLLYQNLNNNGLLDTYEFITESNRPGSLSEFINAQGLPPGNYFVFINRATIRLMTIPTTFSTSRLRLSRQELRTVIVNEEG